MAKRAQPVIAGFGIVTLVAILALTLVPVAALWRAGSGGASLLQADFAAMRFTLFQAFLSAMLSVLFAVPAARALHRGRFPGRALLITLLGAPFLLPVIVAVFGLLAVWGRSGWVSDLLSVVGLGPLNIYGLTGILLAHVFFNLPLATRLILQGWDNIPTEHFRLAEQLGPTGWNKFQLLEWPMLRGVLPGAFLLVMLFCASSFAVALALGGGPAATTVELSIYEALRLDFDLGKAATLALVQLAIGLSLAVLASWSGARAEFGSTLSLDAIIQPTRLQKATDGIVTIFLALFVLLPLAAVLVRGIGGIQALDMTLLPALRHSLVIALGSACLSTAGALALSVWIVRMSQGRWIEALAVLVLSASPLAIGTGLFLVIRPFANPFSLALAVVMVVNAGLALPIALRLILPAWDRANSNYRRLVDGLGMDGATAVRLVWWPAMRAPLGFAAGVSAALSMGDLGVVALFSDPNFATLPLIMYRQMGSYQMEAASATGLVLVAVSFGLFVAFDQWGRHGRHA